MASTRVTRPRGSVRYVVGLMSGTSADGIDAACVRIEGRGERMRVELVRHLHRAFPAGLRRRLLSVMAPADVTTQDLARLHAELGDAFGRAATEAIRSVAPAHRPTIVGLAGQTICHYPDLHRGTVTLQLGEVSRVAAHTGLITVGEFRQGDVAAGGQGAPLVPWTDWVLFRDPRVTRAVQNIGGVANVTWLPAGCGSADVIAFDTGPGNMIIDGLVARITGGRRGMDAGGAMSARGRVLERVLERWLKHPYLHAPPPKTTGRETFGSPFIEREWPRLRRASARPDDWVATATAFTARTIALAYRPLLARAGGGTAPQRGRRAAGGRKVTAVEVIVCGGGSRNPVLMSMLAAELPGVRIRTIDDFGIPSEAKEALSFAMLAAARLDEVPANLPQVTGARRPVVMGHVAVP